MLDWLFPIFGASLLLLLAVDVFRTVFHAEGRGGPINRIQNRVIWAGIRRLGTRGAGIRPHVLALAGPVMATSTIVVWNLLLVAGFMLIYLPHIHDFHFSPSDPGARLLDAFYYSGIVAATLGQGDVVASGAVLRSLTVVQALLGFALVTVAVTYVLGIYRELVTVQALATVLNVRLRGYGGEPTKEGRTTEPTAAGIEDADEDWDRSITMRLAAALTAHFNYPILHYFRPSDSRRSLLAQVARLVMADRGLNESHHGGRDESKPILSSVSHRALSALTDQFVAEIHSLFVGGEAASDEEISDVDMERLRQVLAMMAYEVPGEA